MAIHNKPAPYPIHIFTHKHMLKILQQRNQQIESTAGNVALLDLL